MTMRFNFLKLDRQTDLQTDGQTDE